MQMVAYICIYIYTYVCMRVWVCKYERVQARMSNAWLIAKLLQSYVHLKIYAPVQVGTGKTLSIWTVQSHAEGEGVKAQTSAISGCVR